MKYRITTTFPVYFNGDCLPSTGYVLQVLQEGIFRDKWVDVKTFAKIIKMFWMLIKIINLEERFWST